MSALHEHQTPAEAVAHVVPGEWEERYHKGLADENLRQNVRVATTRMAGARETRLTQDLVDVAAWKQAAKSIKEHTIAHLDYYLAQAADNIRKNGGQVHFAVDGDEAREIIVDIAKRVGAKKVVKSKSMVSEETHLNHALEAIGIESVETDLGEYIVQLAGETPVHLITPAFHKNRRDVAALLSRVMGEEVSSEPRELTSLARRILRDKFLEADVGISGGNFVVAETGTVTLVTNEGNGRMCTSLPRVHIALVGIEKLVPTVEDLGVLISVLARSATGQKISVYTTLVSAPRQAAEVDGPEEFHVVFVDNGRSGALGTEFQEALHCIRCGACINVCPVYRNIGGHAYGGVYSGPIGAVITPVLAGLENAPDLPMATSLCGACTEVCPVGIHLHDHLIRLRAKLVETNQAGWAERFVFKSWVRLWSRTWGYKLSARLARWLSLPFSKGGRLRWAPAPLSGWTKHRDFPLPAARTFRDRWADLAAEEVAERG